MSSSGESTRAHRAVATGRGEADDDGDDGGGGARVAAGARMATSEFKRWCSYKRVARAIARRARGVDGPMDG